MFSKKATKIDKIFTIDLMLCSKHQIDDEDFVNFCGLLRKYELYNQVEFLFKLKITCVSLYLVQQNFILFYAELYPTYIT